MSKRPLHIRTMDVFSYIVASLRFAYHQRQEKKLYGDYFFSYTPLHKGESIRILANGPSLNKELEELISKNIDLSNSLVLNYFVSSDIFTKIKPRYYCLADPLFFTEENYTEKVHKLFEELNKVDWEITLFVWIQGVATINKYVQNKNITIKGISTLTYEGSESRRNEYYEKGIAVPSYVNVTIMGLYVLLNLGYSEICLYGVDHTFLKEIVIDDDNDLCILNQHFYGDEFRKYNEIRDGIKWGVSEFIYNYYLTFVEHKRMRNYADYLGASIINCTHASWIDAYTRIAQMEKQSENNIQS